MSKLIKELYGVMEPYNNMLDLDINKFSIDTQFKQVYNMLEHKGGSIKFKSGKEIMLTGTDMAILRALSLMSNEIPDYYSQVCLHFVYYYLMTFMGNKCDISDKIPNNIKEKLFKVVEEVRNETTN